METLHEYRVVVYVPVGLVVKAANPRQAKAEVDRMIHQLGSKIEGCPQRVHRIEGPGCGEAEFTTLKGPQPPRAA